MIHLRNRIKSILERSLGVTISRTPRMLPGKHSDQALLRLRDWSADDVVFDVGANDGRTVLRISDPLCAPRIFAFEPVSSTYRKLCDRTRHLHNVRCFPYAMGEQPGHKEIHVNEIEALSSFSPDWGKAVRRETVEVQTIDQFMVEHGVDFIHYLKIDTEGHELQVLEGAREALRSSRIAILQAEVGLGQTEHEFVPLEQLRRHLLPMGYVLYGIYNQCHAPAHAPRDYDAGILRKDAPQILVYCDALFIRADT